MTALAACDPATDVDDSAPLSDYAALFDGAPSNDELPFELKADGPAPLAHTDLLLLQSPVKSQGKRGVCSIFSTVALMEHLYIAAGDDEPDFSEQYLQWSAKFEVGSFPNTSGSNSSYNLQAINRFGIPEESAWPYEVNQWNEFDDPECAKDNEDKPTRCYTNGAPPDSALAAEKFFLPAGRWVNSRRASIMDHIRVNGTGVIVGLDFFYQSWNHRKSELPRNMDYWAEGVVLYPNEKDLELSRLKRAGHSILIVGWDSDLEIPIVDADGEFVEGANGELVTEKGFFIIKNSWGTSGFGVDNPHGSGYGYLSMKYVEDFAWARTADLPDIDLPPPGDDGADGDDDGGGEGDTFTSTEVVAIPDNDPAGARSTLEVDVGGEVRGATVSIDIEHSWRGDLVVELIKDDVAVTLHEKTGGGQKNL
ncbi:MAG: C1 family peptidase, partial [Myxococcota bacterium]